MPDDTKPNPISNEQVQIHVLQAQLLVVESRGRAMKHLIRQLVQQLKLSLSPPATTFDEEFAVIQQAELQSMLATIANTDQPGAAGLTKYLIAEGHLKQTSDDSFETS